MNSDEQLLARLPHQPPFRFITNSIELDHCLSGTASWCLTGNEPFFAGHFPGAPIVPGVLIAEALAQLSGLILFGADNADVNPPAISPAVPARLAHVDVRFLDAVSPPAEIKLQSKFARDLGTLRLFDVEARMHDRIVARGQLTLVITAPTSPMGTP